MMEILVLYGLAPRPATLRVESGKLIRDRVTLNPTFMGALCGWGCKPEAHQGKKQFPDHYAAFPTNQS